MLESRLDSWISARRSLTSPLLSRRSCIKGVGLSSGLGSAPRLLPARILCGTSATQCCCHHRPLMHSTYSLPIRAPLLNPRPQLKLLSPRASSQPPFPHNPDNAPIHPPPPPKSPNNPGQNSKRPRGLELRFEPLLHLRQAASAALGLSLGALRGVGGTLRLRDLGFCLPFFLVSGLVDLIRLTGLTSPLRARICPVSLCKAKDAGPGGRSASSSKSSGSGRLGLGPSAAQSSSRDLAGLDLATRRNSGEACLSQVQLGSTVQPTLW